MQRSRKSHQLKRGKKRLLTAKKHLRLIKDYKSNKSNIGQLAKKYNLTISTCYNYIKKYKVE